MKIINLFIIGMLLVLITGCSDISNSEENDIEEDVQNDIVEEENKEDSLNKLPSKEYIVLNENNQLTEIKTYFFETGIEYLKVNDDKSISLNLINLDYEIDLDLTNVDFVFDEYFCSVNKYLINDEEVKEEVINLNSDEKLTINFNCANFSGNTDGLTGMIVLDDSMTIQFLADKYIVNKDLFPQKIGDIELLDIEIDEDDYSLENEIIIWIDLIYSNDYFVSLTVRPENLQKFYDFIREDEDVIYKLKNSKGDIILTPGSDKLFIWFTADSQIESILIESENDKLLNSEFMEVFTNQFPVNNEFYNQFNFQEYVEDN